MTTLTCKEIVELVTAYLEGDLDDQTTESFEEHLAVCPGCETYVEQFRITIARLGEVPLESLSDDAQTNLLDTFRNLPR
ncbi:MAG TPA: zf-HC2 domain-containing protein [Nocardioidaceae bacterium]|nr:zf-HC2 domain-containing protein [Nocardioidaceae bacterium]